MARIRSIHPGFFTDEDLVSVSFPARLLLLGLGVEADDKGVFEWKALTIKMRLFPADNVDVDTLLCELESVNAICRFQHGAKSFGGIRNFRKFQRPKTPNDIHPLPAEFRGFVGLGETVSETDGGKPRRFPPKGEIVPQMEDGRKEVEEDPIQEDKVSSASAGSHARTREGFRVLPGGAS